MPTAIQTPRSITPSDSQHPNTLPASTPTEPKPSPLEVLQTVYQALNPRYEATNSANDMDTAALIQKLEKLSLPEGKDNTTAETNLYELLDNRFLSKTLTITPNTLSPYYKAAKDPAPIELTYKTFLTSLGGKLLIKGSSIKAMKQNRLFGQNNAQQDLDAYIKVHELSDKNTIGQLAKALRNAQTSAATDLTDEQIISLYTREETNSTQNRQNTEAVKPNFLSKFRLNVNFSNSIPIDLSFYTQLPAEFDSLGSGSDQLTVNIHNKTAEERELIDQDTQNWLKAKKLIWLHDEMTGGLTRIQKHYYKTPDLRLLQSGIIGKHYDRATPQERLAFLKSLLNPARTATTPKLAKTLSQTATRVAEMRLSDNKYRVDQENLNYFIKREETNNNAKNTEADHAIGLGLLTCLRAVQDFHKFFYKALEDHPEFMPSAQQIDTIFPKPSLSELSHSWPKSGAESTKQLADKSLKKIASIMKPMALQVIGDHLFKSDHATDESETQQQQASITDLLLDIATKENNTQQQLRLISLKLETAQNEAAKKSAMSSLISLGKTLGQGKDPLTAPMTDILNTLATQTLTGKNLQTVKKLYANALSRPSKDIATHTALNNDAKSTLLLWQSQAELDAFAALSMNEDIAPEALVETTFSRINDFNQQASRLRNTLAELTKIPLSKNLAQHFFSVKIKPSTPANSLSSGDKRCLITEDYIHLGKFKLQHKTNPASATIKGNGLQWRNTQQLHIGNFDGTFLSDEAADIITNDTWYSGQVYRNELGLGRLVLRDSPSLQKELAPLITSIRNASQRETANTVPFKKEGENLVYSLYEDFSEHTTQELNTLSHHNFPNTTINISSPDITMSIDRENGAYVMGSIDGYAGNASQYLSFSMQSDDNQVAHIIAEQSTLTDITLEKRVTGTLNLDTFNIEGNGVIVSTDNEKLEYDGELINFIPHGYGRLFTADAPVGVSAYRESGVAVDPDVADVEQALGFKMLAPHLRPRSVHLYNLPAYAENALFSLMDDEGNKMHGLWVKGHVTGHMRKVSEEGIRASKGEFFTIPETICSAAQALGISFGDDVLTLKDKKGVQHRFIPIGNHVVEQSNATQEQTAKKTVAYALGRALSQQFTHSALGHESAPLTAGDFKQHVVINDTNGYKKIYIGETKQLTQAGRIHQIPHGKGITVASGYVYEGQYEDGSLTGAGHSIGFDGSHFRGKFQNSQPLIGEMTLPNGIKVFGSFKKNQPHGNIKMAIPAYPETRTYWLNSVDEVINGTVEERMADGSPGQIKVLPFDGKNRKSTTHDLMLLSLNESKANLEIDQRKGIPLHTTKGFQKLVQYVISHQQKKQLK